MTTALKQLEVKLPVCPMEACDRVGKIPGSFAVGRFYCTGEIPNTHRRVQMKLRLFREVERGEG